MDKSLRRRFLDSDGVRCKVTHQKLIACPTGRCLECTSTQPIARTHTSVQVATPIVALASSNTQAVASILEGNGRSPPSPPIKILGREYLPHPLQSSVVPGMTRTLQNIFTVRRCALHGLCDRNSVCLSVTLVDCVLMVRPTIMISSPYGRPIILASGDITFIPTFEEGRSPRARALNEGGVGTNWRFSTNEPPYLRNGARYDKGYY